MIDIDEQIGKLQIIGKGGFAREVAQHIVNYCGYRVINFFEYDGVKDAIGSISTIIAIGDPAARQRIFNENILNYVTFIAADKKNISNGIICGRGVIICPGTIITSNVKIGDAVIINLNCTVGHDCKIGSFTTISPGVNISGNVTIGEGCYIGTNAAIREGVTICDNVVIGMCAAVISDITEPGTYVGVPAKKIK